MAGNQDPRFGEVLRAFGVSGQVLRSDVLGHGHIHHTTSVTVEGGQRFVVQELNNRVFPNLDACEANIRRLDDHFRNASSLTVTIPEHLRSEHERVHATLSDGSTWRATNQVEQTYAPAQLNDAEEGYSAGQAFGSFVIQTASLPGPPLAATISGFHDFPWRVQQLQNAVSANAVGRRETVSDELTEAKRLIDVVQSAAFEISRDSHHSVHNDAKITNLLCDVATKRPVAVVDLDTVMPGSPLIDLGELVRSGASERPEDARDLQLIEVRPDIVRALIDGFRSTGALTREQTPLIHYAGPIMSIENGIRFLADYLNGDVYFRSQRPGQNLDRARVQFRLADQLLRL